MSMEELNGDLRTAKAHLQKGSAEADAAHEIGETMAVTASHLSRQLGYVSGYIPYKNPDSLYPDNHVGSGDILSSLRTAAGLFGNAHNSLSNTMDGSDNEHILKAGLHLLQAAEILQNDEFGSIAAAERVKANIDTMNVKIRALGTLIAGIDYTATRLQTNLDNSTSDARRAVEGITDFQQEAGLPQ